MVTCGCCGPGSAQTQLSPSWSRVHPRLPVSRLAAGTSQGFMAPSSVGIGCAWHTLRLLTEVSPSFPLSQFRFLQPLLFRCIPTPFPAPFIPQESDGHPALGLCIPWAMKDPLGQNQSPSPCVPGRQAGARMAGTLPGTLAQPVGPGPQETPKTGCTTACRGTSGGSMDPRDARQSTELTFPATGTTGLQAYFPPFPHPVKGLGSWELSSLRSRRDTQSQAESPPVPTSPEVGREDVPKPCRKR